MGHTKRACFLYYLTYSFSHAPLLTAALAVLLGLARLCDRVVVLSDGAVAAQGSHDQLLAECPYYAGQWQSQAGQLV